MEYGLLPKKVGGRGAGSRKRAPSAHLLGFDHCTHRGDEPVGVGYNCCGAGLYVDGVSDGAARSVDGEDSVFQYALRTALMRGLSDG